MQFISDLGVAKPKTPQNVFQCNRWPSSHFFPSCLSHLLFCGSWLPSFLKFYTWFGLVATSLWVRKQTKQKQNPYGVYEPSTSCDVWQGQPLHSDPPTLKQLSCEDLFTKWFLQDKEGLARFSLQVTSNPFPPASYYSHANRFFKKTTTTFQVGTRSQSQIYYLPRKREEKGIKTAFLNAIFLGLFRTDSFSSSAAVAKQG